ncbi:MAG: DUF1801 domain-containing protein [Inhella sp.]
MHQRVSAYLQSLPSEQAGQVRELRQLVMAAAPGLSECWKWSQPVYEHGGPVCWIKAHKAHVTLGFWRGRQLPSASDRMEGGGDKMGHLKFGPSGAMDSEWVQQLVREAVQLNAERGDPAKGY